MTTSEIGPPAGGPGPVVRPYALTRGRTRPTGDVPDVVSMVYAVRRAASHSSDLEPEHLAVLRQCGEARSVADLASALDLPLGVIRILLSDLRDHGLVRISRPRPERLADIRLLREVADGLRKL